LNPAGRGPPPLRSVRSQKRVGDGATQRLVAAAVLTRPGEAAAVGVNAVAPRRECRFTLPGHADVTAAVELPVAADPATARVAVGGGAALEEIEIVGGTGGRLSGHRVVFHGRDEAVALEVFRARGQCRRERNAEGEDAYRELHARSPRAGGAAPPATPRPSVMTVQGWVRPTTD